MIGSTSTIEENSEGYVNPARILCNTYVGEVTVARKDADEGLTMNNHQTNARQQPETYFETRLVHVDR